MERVADGEEVDEGDVERPPGEQSEAPGEAQQNHQARDAAGIGQNPPVGGLVMGILPLDPSQLDHHDDEDHHADGEDQEEVGHHPHVEGDVITQPAAGVRKRFCVCVFKELHFENSPCCTWPTDMWPTDMWTGKPEWSGTQTELQSLCEKKTNISEINEKLQT